MTNKEFLIDAISKTFQVTSDFATECYNEVNKRDWKIFCSQMGDYDHPNERIGAKKEFQFWLNRTDSEEEFNDKCQICNWLDDCEFYDDNFHKMNEEYKGV